MSEAQITTANQFFVLSAVLIDPAAPTSIPAPQIGHSLAPTEADARAWFIGALHDQFPGLAVLKPSCMAISRHVLIKALDCAPAGQEPPAPPVEPDAEPVPIKQRMAMPEPARPAVDAETGPVRKKASIRKVSGKK